MDPAFFGGDLADMVCDAAVSSGFGPLAPMGGIRSDTTFVGTFELTRPPGRRGRSATPPAPAGS